MAVYIIAVIAMFLAVPTRAQCPCSQKTDDIFATATETPDATFNPASEEPPPPDVEFDTRL
ncbi:MAG TPA: hypothetical protein ENN07_07770 [candidate division Zixibacteria bacterium]|nr:hypothetical protein [candidate division Zixibacteria bacterium]